MIFIWCANLLDFFLTVHNLCLGATEANPLLAPLFHRGNFEAAFLIKNAMTLLGLTILAVFSSRQCPKAKGATYALAIVGAGYVVLICYHISNMVMV